MIDTKQNNLSCFIRANKIILLALLLTIVAALPRLYNLGDLGFYMDEETTAFASRSMAETGTPQMPSGMPYYRAFLQTWLNSISANTFGLDEEFSYRLPSALFGILTIPLLFIFARPFVGVPIAFLAALLLSFSEWHIITSRQARMYVPMLFFYIAFTFSVLRWAQKDTIKHLLIAIFLFYMTASLHRIGVFAAFIPLIALFIPGYATTPQYKLILFSIIGGVSAYIAGNIFIVDPSADWKNNLNVVSDIAGSNSSITQYLSFTSLQITQCTIGLILGAWLGKKSIFQDQSNGKEFRLVARYSLAILFAVTAAMGHLHGAFLSLLLLLLLYPSSLYGYLQQTWKPLITITITALLTATLTISQLGLIPGMKSLLTFPYPNWATLNTISTGITLLFISAMLYLAIIDKRKNDAGVLILLVVSLLPIILVGIYMKWAAARYLLQAYPFIIILCAYALYTSIQYLFKQRSDNVKTPAIAASCLIIVSGILGGHGLLSTYKVPTLNYGEGLNEATLLFPFYPDHKTPGEFVSSHRTDSDIVIAEDVIQQRWYAGPIDYWLRKYNSNSGGSFTYKAADQNLHDIYADSVVATRSLLDNITYNKNQKAWLITSGETYNERELYLIPEQLEWLEHIESTHTPIYTGKDNITNVYCLNCEVTN